MMKKARKTPSLVVLVGALTLVVTVAFSQKPTKVLSGNLAGFLSGVPYVEYQQNISDASAWALRGLYWGYSSEGWDATAIGTGGSYRGFINPTAPGGAYWGGGLDAFFISAKYLGEEGSAFVFGPKLEFGYRFLLGAKKNFTISIGLELGYYIGKLEILGSELKFGGVAAGVPVTIGFAW